MPNCAKKKCPVSPKTGKVCDGKGWCDSKTGLCVCNRDPTRGLEYPVDHHPWYAVAGSKWDNGEKRAWDSAHSGMASQVTLRAGDMHSVGQQEVQKAWEAGYSVRWAAQESFHRYLNYQQHSTHGGSWPWWDRAWKGRSWPWWEHESATDTIKPESGILRRSGTVFPRTLGDLHQAGDSSQSTGVGVTTVSYNLVPKYHGPDCGLKRCPVSKNNRYGLWLECNYQGSCDHSTGRCKCHDSGWFGDDCSRKRCPIDPLTKKECAGHGTCTSATGRCQCKGKYFGPDCALSRCPMANINRGNQMLECNGQGSCDRRHGKCVCFDQYQHPASQDPACVKKRCPVYPKYNGLTCNGHGSCQPNTGHCHCHAQWSAHDCSIQAPSW